MRAIRLEDSSEESVLVEEDVPRPHPGPGEILIRVCAAGVTPTELLWYPTTHTKNGEKRARAVPGHEFSGVVASMGKRVTGFDLGEAVYGLNGWFTDGAMAEYCLAQPSGLSRKPLGLSHIEAATVPIGALTAWQGLIDRARLQAGERVLVHGGAGAVGLFAVQIARSRGAHVIATASERNLNFISHIGAEQVIDYRAGRLEDGLQAVDVVFDTVGGETLERSWNVLSPHGRMVTIASGSESSADERVKKAFFIVEPNSRQLEEIGSLLQTGELQAVVDIVLPLSQAPDAFAGKLKGRRGRGKMVVAVAPEQIARRPA